MTSAPTGNIEVVAAEQPYVTETPALTDETLWIVVGAEAKMQMYTRGSELTVSVTAFPAVYEVVDDHAPKKLALESCALPLALVVGNAAPVGLPATVGHAELPIDDADVQLAVYVSACFVNPRAAIPRLTPCAQDKKFVITRLAV